MWILTTVFLLIVVGCCFEAIQEQVKTMGKTFTGKKAINFNVFESVLQVMIACGKQETKNLKPKGHLVGQVSYLGSRIYWFDSSGDGVDTILKAAERMNRMGFTTVCLSAGLQLDETRRVRPEEENSLFLFVSDDKKTAIGTDQRAIADLSKL